MQRPDWTTYFGLLAQTVALRASCPRAQVGCVITTPSHRILGTGYNGAPAGMPHCHDDGCIMERGLDDKLHCIRSRHAEHNAIEFLLDEGVSLQGSILYATHQPCPLCISRIHLAGIAEIFFFSDYGSTEALALAARHGIVVTKGTL